MPARISIFGKARASNLRVTQRPTTTAATTPTAADSVGLAKPVTMEPTMTTGIDNVGSAPSTMRPRSRSVMASPAG